ncbi:MAG TPA: serine protease [Polyangia bacterium]|jgi:hypothetical protein|nr:serine protease [Polyangia bacterium]
MTTEPRDPALAALARATVHVGTGSGVVIWPPNSALLIATAAHVVRTGEVHLVRKGAVFDGRPVIAHDEQLDLALLTAPTALEAAALEITDETTDALPGDGIWAAGFPQGWDGPEPVVVPGTIAASATRAGSTLTGVGETRAAPFAACWAEKLSSRVSCSVTRRA